MTNEFPRVRLQLIRYLHEQLGFDVLAFEGSWLQAWLAEDLLYRCKDSVDCVEDAQRLAWFPLWQTDAMRSVLDYVVATQRTAHPLYLASFDNQPGSDAKFQGSGEAALAALFAALEQYPAKRDPAIIARWQHALPSFFGCYPEAPKHTDAERQAAVLALSELRAWIQEIAPSVQPATHARALRSIPDSLEKSVQLCTVAPTSAFGPGTYQQLRDQLNANNVIALRDRVSQRHRIILWAHHSHVRQEWSTQLPSMGQRIEEMIGNELYTVGVFAGDGESISVDDRADPPLALRKLPSSSGYELESALSKLSDHDFLLDFSTADQTSPWMRRMSFRDENGTGHVVPAKSFSALVFVHKIHAPEPFADKLQAPVQH
jgi:erythromycin esterase